MSYPSDYRYLPFSDTPNYVSKTEYHQIPATSPYEVRLNEVPEKASPSTMTIKIVTGFTDGAPVYGATMTEVSATPASGEYYPDYYTEADGDSNWNTGTIQFNSANANTTIEVTYMATGELASVKSNHYPSWMTDRGDGSDGVFAPTSNTTITGGEKNYTTVNIPVGVTVTFSDNAIIKCQGAFVNNGTITVSVGGNGGSRNSGVGGSGLNAGAGGKGGKGDGGDGGSGGAVDKLNVFGAAIFLYGSGGGGGGGEDGSGHGGAGGSGGGCLIVVATSLINNIINANGGNGQNGNNSYCGGGGGGGGGSVVLVANTITQGTLNVNGGSGGSGYQNGSGGTAGITYVKELGNA